MTGLSGAGRSTTLHVLEDLGFYCVDNLPPKLVPQLIDILASDKHVNWVALGIDMRAGTFFEGLQQLVTDLRARGNHVELVFLECRDEILLRRFSETRRPHRLAASGDLATAISAEREKLAPLRAQASYIIDTSELTVHDLRRSLSEYMTQDTGGAHMTLRIVSFGYKYGLPTNADLVFDLRALRNPYFVPALKPHTGEYPTVRDFVLSESESQELLHDIETLLRHHLPHYEREGRSYLTVALGCTGGRHRSVAMGAELARRLAQERSVILAHRDIDRGKLA